MAITQQQVGEVAAGLMEQLERTYGADESAEVTDVFIITAVDHNHGQHTTVHFNVSGGMSTHTGIGLLEQIKHQLLR